MSDVTRDRNQVLVASAARTTSSDSGVLTGYADRTWLRVALVVTAASGTGPSMTVTLEDTLDGTNWFTIGSFAAKTAAATEVINITQPFTDQIRVKWAITGTTPSFTFSVQAYSE